MQESVKHWNATEYHDLARPQHRMGMKMLSSIDEAAFSTICDAGCGSGIMTMELAKRFPSARIFAVDRQKEMLDEAKKHLAVCKSQVEFVQSDLTELKLASPVQLMFSNAVLHHILDHDRLFASVHQNMASGSLLVAQFGGSGNIKNIHDVCRVLRGSEPFKHYFNNWQPHWKYAGPEEMQARLEKHKFSDVRVEHCSEEATFDDLETFSRFMRFVPLRPYLSYLPTSERKERFFEEFMKQWEERGYRMCIDYCRLSIWARA